MDPLRRRNQYKQKSMQLDDMLVNGEALRINNANLRDIWKEYMETQFNLKMRRIWQHLK
jgi:hypothetical protein